MKCSVPGCDKVAHYRTLDDIVIDFLCLKHTELGLDLGWPPEKLVSIREKAS